MWVCATFSWTAGAGVVVLPGLILLMVLTAAGLGMWLTATAVQYRDVSYAMSFLVQLLMYAAPVVYPTSLVPERFRLFYALNPMVGVIEGFRSVLLGTQPFNWSSLALSFAISSVLLVSSVLFFRRLEHRFADVV
jgi:lipopolysaccharide transport system permease protein